MTPTHIALALQVSPGGQASQSVLLTVPQVAFAVLETQPEGHRWFPTGHAVTHEVPLQEMLPPAGAAGQAAQVLPHEAVLVLPLTTQVAPQA